MVIETMIGVCKPFPRRQILDSSKLKEFADKNFKSDENGTEFSKWVENKQFLLFHSVFKRLVVVLQTRKKTKGL